MKVIIFITYFNLALFFFIFSCLDNLNYVPWIMRAIWVWKGTLALKQSKTKFLQNSLIYNFVSTVSSTRIPSGHKIDLPSGVQTCPIVDNCGLVYSWILDKDHFINELILNDIFEKLYKWIFRLHLPDCVKRTFSFSYLFPEMQKFQNFIEKVRKGSRSFQSGSYQQARSMKAANMVDPYFARTGVAPDFRLKTRLKKPSDSVFSISV